MPYVYILECSDSSLYAGCAVDLEKRIAKHQNSEGAKYTRGRLPVQLLYSEHFNTFSEAMKREKEIQKMNRKEKLAIIKRCRATVKFQ